MTVGCGRTESWSQERTSKNEQLGCDCAHDEEMRVNVADDSGLFCAQEAMDDRGIHRLLLIALCHRHAILWHDHQSSNNDKMTPDADSDRKCEPTSTSLVQDNNDHKKISNAI